MFVLGLQRTSLCTTKLHWATLGSAHRRIFSTSASRGLADLVRTRLEAQIRTVNVNPKLSESRKYQITRRLFAALDAHSAESEYHSAFGRLRNLHKEIASGVLGSPVTDHERERAVTMLQQLETAIKNRAITRWEFCRLCLMAPRFEVNRECRVRCVAVIIFTGLQLPVKLLGIRFMLFVIEHGR